MQCADRCRPVVFPGVVDLVDFGWIACKACLFVELFCTVLPRAFPETVFLLVLTFSNLEDLRVG
jgi:hypothetical protein